AVLDRCRAGLEGAEVAALLELGEEVDTRLDVVERPVVRQRGRVDAGEGGSRPGRVAVERNLALVTGLQQIGEGLRTGLDPVGVAADRDVAPVVVVPAGLRVLLIAGDRVVSG